MERKSCKSVLDSLDFTIVDDNSQVLGIGKLEMIRNYLLNKREGEYNQVDVFELPYIMEQLNYIIENKFKLNNNEIRAEYNKLRKQLIRWFVECNTQDKNENK